MRKTNKDNPAATQKQMAQKPATQKSPLKPTLEQTELYRLCEDLQKQSPSMLLSLPSLPAFIRTLHAELVAKRSEKTSSSSKSYTDSPVPFTPPPKRRLSEHMVSPNMKLHRSDSFDYDTTPTKKRKSMGDLPPKKGSSGQSSNPSRPSRYSVWSSWWWSCTPVVARLRLCYRIQTQTIRNHGKHTNTAIWNRLTSCNMNARSGKNAHCALRSMYSNMRLYTPQALFGMGKISWKVLYLSLVARPSFNHPAILELRELATRTEQ